MTSVENKTTQARAAKLEHCRNYLNRDFTVVGRIVALEWTQPVTEMRIRDFACGQRLPVHRANYFAIFMC
jgi:hypothetical protein